VTWRVAEAGASSSVDAMLVDKCVVVELRMRDRGAGVESVNQDFAAPLSLKIGRAWENHHSNTTVDFSLKELFLERYAHPCTTGATIDMDI